MSFDFVALDVETANAFRGSICQVGMALVTEGRVTRTWTMLVRPPVGRDNFDANHVAVHGITAAQVEHMPRFIAQWPVIEGLLRGRPVVAHNANFEMGAIREATSYCGFDWPELDVACSLVLARQRFPDLDRHTLDACCAAAGVSLTNHHDALSDAVACAELTLQMARSVQADDLDDLLTASGVAWGRLSESAYVPCHSVGPDVGVAVPRLF
ncbi:MAG: 3'-5' exonuclease [Actinobacteria bacterium]|nr:3'-5' exonuclease [Actinomycetota bacterium]